MWETGQRKCGQSTPNERNDFYLGNLIRTISFYVHQPYYLKADDVGQFTGDQILKICYLAATSKLVDNFVPIMEPPQQAVPPETKCNDLMANCRKVTALADWPSNALGRLPNGDKVR